MISCRRLPQPIAVDLAQQLRLPSSRHRCNNIWMQSRNIFQSFSSISVCLQAAAFTIGQSMGVPAPSYNPGAAGAPAAPGRVKTVICKKYDKPEGEDLAFCLQNLKFLALGCPYGERCTFAHGQHELGTQSKSNLMYKTVSFSKCPLSFL